MMWIGLLVGASLGAIWFGLQGFVALGFVGWLAGLIIGAARKPKAPPPTLATPRVDRVKALETRLAALEARVAQLEGGNPEAADSTPTAPAAETAAATAQTPASVETPAVEPALPPIEPALAPVAPVPPPAREPAPPNPLIGWLMGGNTIARAGVVILFLGLAFLLKWAVDHAMLPPEVRVGGVALAGVAMLLLGWRLRAPRRAYALGLQGGGVAVLYLTTFAALRLYSLLPPTLAFMLLAFIAAFSAMIAVMQDALVLAIFGVGGGFLAPILASTGTGSHVVLFGYYLLLNLGIAGIAFFRSWRSLDILGFLFTFVIGATWGLRFYAPEYFATTEPFLVAFFLLYVAVALVHALRTAPARMAYPDGILVFGVPAAAFGLQAALVRDTEYGLAFSCVAASSLYLSLAALLRTRANVRMLFESFLALGVVFATLAIPLALDARWTSALWALEGTAVAWIGLRQRRRIATGFGLLMQLLAGGAFWFAYGDWSPGIPWIDAAFLGATLLAVAGFWSNRLLSRSPWQPLAPPVAPMAFAWGFAWLLFAAHHDIEHYVAFGYHVQAWVGFCAVASTAFLALSRRLAWPHAAWPSLLLMPALLLLALVTIADDPHPFAGWGALAWALAAAAHFANVRRRDAVHADYTRLEHAVTLLVLIAIAAAELHYWAVRETGPHTAWSVASVVVPPAIVLMGLSARAMDARWPVSDHAIAYRLHVPLAIAFATALWIVYANATHDGASDPLPYLPLLNALDFAHVLVGIALASAALAARRSGLALPGSLRRPAAAWTGALAFIWLNGVLLRTLHHWAHIPYRTEAMMRSMLVQASLSIFWSALALALMLYAVRKARRGVWITGAALMAVVVVKLFVVELSHAGAVERIVSFIVVGLLMLAIGYVAPVPPRDGQARS
ncbi:MAG TPA: DUF2339 domain-containing protein [Usitatibacter sp.]|nr:DUF2339 domain-containing protein [Usitatibacter sp.]